MAVTDRQIVERHGIVVVARGDGLFDLRDVSAGRRRIEPVFGECSGIDETEDHASAIDGGRGIPHRKPEGQQRSQSQNLQERR